jgi:hypothetical protein
MGGEDDPAGGLPGPPRAGVPRLWLQVLIHRWLDRWCPPWRDPIAGIEAGLRG